MEVKATLVPGEKGTKALLQQYGDALVCVRYRYDKQKHKRYKTVELIVDEKDWRPNVICHPDRRVYLRIAFGEAELREQVKQHGGYWNPDKKAWHLGYREAIELGLEQRIIGDMPF